MDRLAQRFTGMRSATIWSATLQGAMGHTPVAGFNANEFGSSGFRSQFYEAPPGNNQIRHTVGGLIAGYAGIGLDRMNAREDPNTQRGRNDINLTIKQCMLGEMGVALQSIDYGDVTADGSDEAMVVLSMVTGGSATPHATYVYAWKDGKPTLLWAISTGDRAEGGLRRLYAEKGDLVIKLYSPVNSKWDCCPTLFTRTHYKWHHNHFEQQGKEEVLTNSQGLGWPLMKA